MSKLTLFHFQVNWVPYDMYMDEKWKREFFIWKRKVKKVNSWTCGWWSFFFLAPMSMEELLLWHLCRCCQKRGFMELKSSSSFLFIFFLSFFAYLIIIWYSESLPLFIWALVHKYCRIWIYTLLLTLTHLSKIVALELWSCGDFASNAIVMALVCTFEWSKKL